MFCVPGRGSASCMRVFTAPEFPEWALQYRRRQALTEARINSMRKTGCSVVGEVKKVGIFSKK